ncbi:MAG: precorrin-3B C(17)-methyltransferase [Actinobacteria bacterium]|nr:precorrin-3B C(17)-methyltransferase [Actinomycetota bacterium]
MQDGNVRDALRAAWSSCDRVVMVMAVGAAVRLIAPLLDDKRRDPGVVCVDDATRFAVALTGGHEGGANALAEHIAAYLRATAVVTTASDAFDVPTLVDVGAAFGVRTERDGDLAAVGGALVSGAPVNLLREVAWPLGPLPGVTEVDAPAAPLLLVTDRVVDPPRPCVVYRPPSLVVGVGASRGVTADEVGDLIDATLAAAGLSSLSVACVATVDAKADEAGIIEAAVTRGWPLVTLPAGVLATIAVPHPSAVVAAAVGTPSVAEAAALHRGGDLLVAKRKSTRATVAVARRAPRGHLALVSLGPGDPELVPARARRALARAEVVVGYTAYLDLARPLLPRGAATEPSPLGDEVARARRALDLARQGRSVALVSSGDVGVYAMAAPTIESSAGDGAEAPVDVEIVPGVTAAQAAASLLGAPLGHDHCAISLSDLLTPWRDIRRRLRAAAAGDFVVALYNPRSATRDWQLDEARRILLAHRSPDTPVGVVRDAYRTASSVQVTTLAALDPATVDMRTVVLVGSTRTRMAGRWMLTPRGATT